MDRVIFHIWKGAAHARNVLPRICFQCHRVDNDDDGVDNAAPDNDDDGGDDNDDVIRMMM